LSRNLAPVDRCQARAVADGEDRELVEPTAVDQAGGEGREAGLGDQGGEDEELGVEGAAAVRALTWVPRRSCAGAMRTRALWTMTMSQARASSSETSRPLVAAASSVAPAAPAAADAQRMSRGANQVRWATSDSAAAATWGTSSITMPKLRGEATAR
jgi:hypothetical protein